MCLLASFHTPVLFFDFLLTGFFFLFPSCSLPSSQGFSHSFVVDSSKEMAKVTLEWLQEATDQ